MDLAPAIECAICPGLFSWGFFYGLPSGLRSYVITSYSIHYTKLYDDIAEACQVIDQADRIGIQQVECRQLGAAERHQGQPQAADQA